MPSRYPCPCVRNDVSFLIMHPNFRPRSSDSWPKRLLHATATALRFSSQWYA